MQRHPPSDKFRSMFNPTGDLTTSLGQALAEYHSVGDPELLRERLQAAAQNAMPDAIVVAAERYRDDPHVIAPLYEVVVAAQPQNARALVILANAYWLQGRGPTVVAELANRAIEADPNNRGAWHLWALSESDPRNRVARWQQVSARFPADNLALAAVADNAASVAGAEHDYEMLDLAIATFEALHERSESADQRKAVETALTSLRGWKF
jgi:hypothetical protein